MKRLLLAVGDPDYSLILKKAFARHDNHFQILEQEVLHYKYLMDVVSEKQPDILLIHDSYLESGIDDSNLLGRQWLKTFNDLRKQFEDKIRVVFLCERSEEDSFLGALVSINVLDIFNGQTIKIDTMIEQLMEPPRYANVSKYRTELNKLVIDIPQEEEEEKTASSPKEKKYSEKQDRPIVNKIIEKKVVQKVVEKKVVNKQVVKRQIGIHLHNKVEKVVGVPVAKTIVVIASPLPRVGTTFVSHLLMNYTQKLGLKTTYIENPYRFPYTYDRLNGFQKQPLYKSVFYEPKHEDEEYTTLWEEEGIDLVVTHPDENRYTTEDITFDAFSKILLSNDSTVTIIDVGSHWKEEAVRDLFDIAHQVYFVLEPDIANFQYLEEGQDETLALYHKLMLKDSTRLILNRSHEKLLKNEVIQTIAEEKKITCVPTLPSEQVFNAQYKGELLLTHTSLEEMTNPYLKELVKDFLPSDFLKKQIGKKGLLKGLFKRSISINQNTVQTEEK